MPSPSDISILASAMSPPDASLAVSEIISLMSSPRYCQYIAVPRASLRSGRGNVPGRTVAICGNPMQFMSAIRVPPNAGLVTVRSLPSVLSAVQSAVRPTPRVAATLGAISLPQGVAPNRTIAGSMREMTEDTHSA